MVRQERLMSHAWTGEAGQRADAHGGTLDGLAQGLARTESQVAQQTHATRVCRPTFVWREHGSTEKNPVSRFLCKIFLVKYFCYSVNATTLWDAI